LPLNTFVNGTATVALNVTAVASIMHINIDNNNMRVTIYV
jgi:hypothetical protein